MMFSFYDQLIIYLCEIRDRVRLVPRLVTKSRGLARLDTVWYQHNHSEKYSDGLNTTGTRIEKSATHIVWERKIHERNAEENCMGVLTRTLMICKIVNSLGLRTGVYWLRGLHVQPPIVWCIATQCIVAFVALIFSWTLSCLGSKPLLASAWRKKCKGWRTWLLTIDRCFKLTRAAATGPEGHWQIPHARTRIRP